MTRFDDLHAGSAYLNRPRRDLCVKCGGLSIAVLDGEPVCQAHADQWARAEGEAMRYTCPRCHETAESPDSMEGCRDPQCPAIYGPLDAKRDMA